MNAQELAEVLPCKYQITALKGMLVGAIEEHIALNSIQFKDY